jgi:hypothetical protein
MPVLTTTIPPHKKKTEFSSLFSNENKLFGVGKLVWAVIGVTGTE